jgi:hypothetical protein
VNATGKIRKYGTAQTRAIAPQPPNATSAPATPSCSVTVASRSTRIVRRSSAGYERASLAAARK